MDEEQKKLVDAWIKMHAAYNSDDPKHHGPDYEANFWAFETLDDMVRHEPGKAWPIILAIRSATDDDRILANLAAGPLEDILARHGEKFIDRVETLARQDEKFLYILTGVWSRSSMSKELWTRISTVTEKSKRHM